MTAHLVATKVAGSTATESSHKPSVALLLHGRVAGTVLLLSGLAVGVLALWILILAVRSLLRELVLRLRAGIASLLLLTVLPEKVVRIECFETTAWLLLPLLLVVVDLLARLLAVLKPALGRRTVLRVVALLFSVPLLAVLLLRLLVTLLLLVAALVIATLGRVRAMALWRVLLLLAVTLVVLVVAGHVVL